MMHKEETPEAHSCPRVYGKIVRVEVDGGGQIYCCECHNKLLPTQVAPQILRIINYKGGSY